MSSLVEAFSESEVVLLVHSLVLKSFCEPPLGSLDLSFVKLVIVGLLSCERRVNAGAEHLTQVINAVVFTFSSVEGFRLAREIYHFLLDGLVFVYLQCQITLFN
jgi:hypothetical protein